MADVIPITLFFLSQRIYSIDSIVFDLILDESHSLDSTVTQMNVEDGSNVNDHIKNELRTGSLTGKITNFSLNDESFIGNKVVAVWEMFKQLRDEKKLVNIVCILDVYEKVAITHVGTLRNKDTGEAAEFAVSFQQMNIVKLEQSTIDIPVKLSSVSNKTNSQSMQNLDKGKIITSGVQ